MEFWSKMCAVFSQGFDTNMMGKMWSYFRKLDKELKFVKQELAEKQKLETELRLSREAELEITKILDDYRDNNEKLKAEVIQLHKVIMKIADIMAKQKGLPPFAGSSGMLPSDLGPLDDAELLNVSMGCKVDKPCCKICDEADNKDKNDGYNPDPKDKPFTSGHQPKSDPYRQFVKPPTKNINNEDG